MKSVRFFYLFMLRVLSNLKFVGLLVCAGMISLIGDSVSASSNPDYWPNSENLSPQIEGWPNAIRIFGQDRYQTSLATSLSLRGDGEFPYTSPLMQSEANLGKSSKWWGAKRCPRSVIIVAGDSPADALSATALSDPTGRSSEPYLRRSQGADLLFDPIGGYKRVDTNFAPVLVTRSARNGATQLTLSTKYAAKDFRSGECTAAREAIIVGGYAAVPRQVDSELIAIGYNSVFRVSGEDRFATASAVAESLGTAPIPSGVVGCTDGSSDDGSSRMTFYANSVIEWRESVSTCELLGRTVVLADGLTGADALAAGWWTAFWQVPVLLHNGTSELPQVTKESLQTLNIKNLVILGGEKRVSSAIADLSASLTGAKIWRVAGVNRYETSVRMAEIFGGWWPSDANASYASSLLCFSSSFGSGANSIGWADSLGAGAWCAAAAAAHIDPPARYLMPVNGDAPRKAENMNIGGHDAVPVILLKAGSYSLPNAVKTFLDGVYPQSRNWCSSRKVVASCVMPGFAAIFGGPSVVTEEAIATLSDSVGGKIASGLSGATPVITNVFSTKISQDPVYRSTTVESSNTTLYLCLPRGSYEDGLWLTAGYKDDSYADVIVNLMSERWYLEDNDGGKRASKSGAPGCIELEDSSNETVWVRLVGLDGKLSAKINVESHPHNYLSLSGTIVAEPPSKFSGIDSLQDPVEGGVTSWDFDSVSPPVNMQLPELVYGISRATISIELNRGDESSSASPDSPDLFTASWRIESLGQPVTGTASGEAILHNGVWSFNGQSTVNNGTLGQNVAIGGFSARLETNLAGSDDDKLVWELDAFGS